jgi:hypothetical protein
MVQKEIRSITVRDRKGTRRKKKEWSRKKKNYSFV